MNKILCIRIAYLGDVLLCSPILRALKNRFPAAEIHFLTQEKAIEMAELIPEVSRWHIYKGNIRQSAAALWKEKFDLIIDFQASPTSKWISSLLFRKKITLPSFVNNKSDGQHVIDFYFQELHELGLKNDGMGIVLNKPNKSITKFNLPAKYSVFALGGRRVTRVVSYPKMIELVDRWEGKLVLLGDQWDRHYADRLAILFPEKVINLCHETSISESAAIIYGGDKVITHDSLMMQLSAAFNKQPMVLYTHTSPSDGYAPYGSAFKAIELQGLSCKPCVNIEKDVCPLYHFDCGMNIPLDAIFE